MTFNYSDKMAVEVLQMEIERLDNQITQRVYANSYSTYNMAANKHLLVFDMVMETGILELSHEKS